MAPHPLPQLRLARAGRGQAGLRALGALRGGGDRRRRGRRRVLAPGQLDLQARQARRLGPQRLRLHSGLRLG